MSDPTKPDTSGHKFIGSCEGGDVVMSAKLSRFPNLVHAPGQHGDGIRTHLKGALIDDIAAEAKKSGLVAALDAEATKHSIDLDELCDALRFARENKAI